MQAFESALGRHQAAKAAHKREETARDIRSAASDLSAAIDGIKQRMELERKDAKLFAINDRIAMPHRFSRALSVTVNYRWRRSTDDPWADGTIIFTHHVDGRADYIRPKPKRKPSAAKLEQELQRQLYLTWEYLMRGALCSMRDFFRDGGDGASVPDTFEAKVDPHTRDLNNYSTQFWRQRP